jgi:hypothetical protein
MLSTPIPKVAYGDSYSLGQPTQMWGKPSTFVHGLVNNGLLARNEAGLVTTEELGRCYRESGTLLDG